MRYKNYDEETLKKIHDTELEILDKFSSICEENNLNYFLTGGTMLGAVRHAGFIPWDDDIDIGMPRNDYDKFIKIAPKLLGNDYYLDCFEYNKNYYLPFAKIKKNNTIFDEFPHITNIHKGIFIDIIPFENVDKINLNLKIRAILIKNIMETMYFKNKIYKLKDTRKPFLVLLLNLFSKRILMKIEKFILTKNKNNQSKYLNALCGTYHYLKETQLREDILPVKKILFEGKKYNGMNKPDVYLSKIFGDYMKLPPKEKRVNHLPQRISFDVLKDNKYESK